MQTDFFVLPQKSTVLPQGTVYSFGSGCGINITPGATLTIGGVGDGGAFVTGANSTVTLGNPNAWRGQLGLGSAALVNLNDLGDITADSLSATDLAVGETLVGANPILSVSQALEAVLVYGTVGFQRAATFFSDFVLGTEAVVGINATSFTFGTGAAAAFKEAAGIGTNAEVVAAIEDDPVAVRTAAQVGRFLGMVDFLPQTEAGDTAIGPDGRTYLSTGGAWVPTGAAPPAIYSTYVSAVEAAGPPASGWPEFKGRLLAALHVLQDAGIADDLVDGAYLGSDGQLASGAPISFSGGAATESVGSFTRGATGFVFSQSDAQKVSWAVAGLQTGTLVGDYQFGHTATGQTSVPVEIRNSTRTQNVVVGSVSGSRLRLVVSNSGSSTISSEISAILPARTAVPTSRIRHTVAASFSSSSHAVYVDGCVSTPTGGANYTGGADMDFVTIGGASAGGPTFRGVQHAWLLFGKVLTESEHREVCRALNVLDRRTIILTVEGDSTAAFQDSPTRWSDNWTDKLQDETGFADAVRVAINAASNGREAADFPADIAGQTGYQYAPGKRNVAVLQGGINDVNQGATGAEAYGHLVAAASAFRSRGFEVLVPTIAVPDSGIYEADIEAINTEVRAGVGEDFDLTADVDAAIPSHDPPYDVLWFDTTHLDAAGNAIVAGLIADAILP